MRLSQYLSAERAAEGCCEVVFVYSRETRDGGGKSVILYAVNKCFEFFDGVRKGRDKSEMIHLVRFLRK